MKRILLTIITALLLSQAVYSQSSGERTTAASGTGSASQQTAAAQAAALDEARRLSKEVVALYRDGKYDEALPLAKRTLELSETSSGSETDIVVSALTNLGQLYIAQNKYGDAIPLLTRILAIKEKQSPPDNLSIGTLLGKLAYLFYMKGDGDKSAAAYQRAIAAKEKAVGPDDLEVARLLLSLADVYRFNGKTNLADQAYERSIIIYSKKLTLDDPALTHAFDRYTCLYAGGKQYNKVGALWKRIENALEPDSKSDTEGMLNGKAISLPKPEYPRDVKGLTGLVVLRVTIDETGKVIEAADLCGGFSILINPSISAARRARFTPTLLNGKAIKVTGILTYRFVAR